MKSFKELPTSKKILTVGAGILAGAVALFYNPEEPTADYYSNETSQTYYEEAATREATPIDANQVGYEQAQVSASNATSGKVVLYDKGLQMSQGSYILPQGWQLQQDIATDPNSGKTINYQVEIKGPKGELIQSLGTANFGTMFGKSFDQSWRELAMTRLQGQLENIAFGNVKSDPTSYQRLQKVNVFQRLLSQGSKIQSLIVPVSGNRNGQPFQGMVQITLIQPGQNAEMFSTLTASLSLGPADCWSATYQAKEQIDESFAYNPAYVQRMDQLNQREMQKNKAYSDRMISESSRAHQMRMADRQAAFDASQQRISDMNQVRDANFNQWMNDFRSSGSSSSSGFSSHDAFIDQIYERNTFNDPNSGQNISLDGQYDRNFTDGLGGYIRTDDPSFNPNAVQGNWTEITPENNNY